MRSFWVTIAIVAVGLAGLGLSRKSDLVYSDGVKPSIAAATLTAGDTTCQAPLQLPDGASFDRVGFLVGTFFKPGPALTVSVRESGSGRELARGDLAAGYPDLAQAGEHVVRVGRVGSAAPLQ